MRITSLIMTIGVVIAAGVGATIITKNKYNTAIASQIATVKSHYAELGLTVSRDVTQHNWFSFNDVLTLTAEPALIPVTGVHKDPYGPLSVTMTGECYILPLYVTCEHRFDKSENLTDGLVSALQQVDYAFTSSVNGLTGELQQSLVTSEMVLDNPQGKITFRPLSLSSESSLSMSELEVEGSWGGLTLENSPRGAQVALDQMHIKTDLEQLAGMLYLGEAQLTIDSFAVAASAQTPLSEATGISVKSVINELDDDSFAISYVMQADSVATVQGGVPLRLADFTTDVTIAGMSQQALAYMTGLSEPGSPGAADSDDMLAELGKRPLTLAVNRVAVKYNDVPFAANGEFTLAPFDKATLEAGALASRLSGELAIVLGQKAPDKLPQLAPMLRQYQQMGVVEASAEGDFTTTLRLADNQLTANGMVITTL